MSDRTYLDVEDLEVYWLLCQLHIEVCGITKTWPKEETYELGAQVRRSSNSSPSQLAEKNDDRHVRNKVEGTNRARGEAAETVHHLNIARMKSYIDAECYRLFREKYKRCIRMLNGLERKLEEKLPPNERRWAAVKEDSSTYGTPDSPSGYPNVGD